MSFLFSYVIIPTGRICLEAMGVTVGNIGDFLFHIAGMIYVIEKESDKKAEGRIIRRGAVCALIVAYIVVQTSIAPLEAVTFCVKLGMNILMLSIFHRILYGGTLLQAFCKALIVYEIYQAMLLVCLVLSYVSASVIQSHPRQMLMFTLLYIFQLAGIYLLGKVMQKVDLDRVLSQRLMKAVLIIISTVILLALVGALNLRETEKSYLMLACYCIIVISVILGSIWLFDKQIALKNQRQLEEENIRLAAKIHKTKEIIPAVAQELKELENSNDVSSTDRLRELAEEMKDLQGVYVEEESIPLAVQKISTGYRIFDRQLEGYVKEAAQKHIELLIMLQNQPKEMADVLGIRQGEMQQLAGDLMRNAIRAVERTKRKDGKILLCFGYVSLEEGYLLEVYDNGEPFSKEILAHLGVRGMTTGGTGHGMADVFEVTEKYGGVLNVEELDEDIYGKVIHILFPVVKKDGK